MNAFRSLLLAALLALAAVAPALAQTVPSIGVNASSLSYNSPESPVIVGFVVATPGRFYVRALGPELKALGVAGAVATAPSLSLFRGSTLIWSYDAEVNYTNANHLFVYTAFAQVEAEAAQTVTGAMKTAWTAESLAEGRVLDLPAGIYSMMVSGDSGTVLVEVYAVDAAAFDAVRATLHGGMWKRDLAPPPLLLAPAFSGGS